MFENVPQSYSENPNILRWWTNELDELLVQLIDRHAWYWPWFAQEAICHVVEEETIERWRAEDPLCEQYAWYNVLMYFAISRAQGKGYRAAERQPQDRRCFKCGDSFNQGECPEWAARRLGSIEALNFCPTCCKSGFFGTVASVRCSKKAIKEHLAALHRLQGVVPNANFFDAPGPLIGLPVEVQAELLALGETRPAVQCIKSKYGSHLAALIDARVLPEGTRRTSRGTQCIAEDGHVCLSLGEKMIDDWLSQHGIPHTREPHYPNSPLRADFKVGDALIEYFGLAGDPEYDAKTVRKRILARREGVQLIEIYPEDVANFARCEELLTEALSRFV